MKKIFTLCAIAFLFIVGAAGVQGAELNSVTVYTAESGDKISSLGDGYYSVKNEETGTYIIINAYGEFVFDASDYTFIYPVNEDGVFAAKNSSGKMALIDANGPITAFEYDEIGSFSDGLAAVRKTNDEHPFEEYGYIDEIGVLIIPCVYSNARDFSCGRAVVQTCDEDTYEIKNAYINTKGAVIFSTGETHLSDFSADKAFYKEIGEDKLVVIDTDGNTINEITVNDGVNFNGSRLKEVIGIKNDYIVYSVHNSEGNNAWGVVDVYGNKLIEAEKFSIDFLGDEYFAVTDNQEDNYCSIVDKSGKTVTTINGYVYYSNGYYKCTEGESTVVRDKNFNTVLEFSSENAFSGNITADEKSNISVVYYENDIASIIVYNEGVIDIPSAETTTESTTVTETTTETTTEPATKSNETTTEAEIITENESRGSQSHIMTVLAVILTVIIILCVAAIVIIIRYSNGKSLPNGLTDILDSIFKK